MYYSKYSSFSLDQIRSEKYDSLCQVLLSLCKNEKIKERMEAILYEGGFDDFSVTTGTTKNNPFIESKKRIAFAHLLLKNPETFDNIITYFIVLVLSLFSTSVMIYKKNN